MHRARIWFSRDCRWLTRHELELLSSWISMQILVFTKSTKFFSFYYQFCIIGHKQWFSLWIILNYSAQILHNYFRFQKGYFLKKKKENYKNTLKKKGKEERRMEHFQFNRQPRREVSTKQTMNITISLNPNKRKKSSKIWKKSKREKAWWMLEKTKRKRKRRESRYPRQTIDNLFV